MPLFEITDGKAPKFDPTALWVLIRILISVLCGIITFRSSRLDTA